MATPTSVEMLVAAWHAEFVRVAALSAAVSFVGFGLYIALVLWRSRYWIPERRHLSIVSADDVPVSTVSADDAPAEKRVQEGGGVCLD